MHCHQVVCALHSDCQATMTSLPLFSTTRLEQSELLVGPDQIVGIHMK